MFTLALLLTLNPAQQAKHDEIERATFARLQAQTEAIFEQDHPNKEMIDDYKKARACYTKLHLYKVQNCDPILARVDDDIAESPKE